MSTRDPDLIATLAGALRMIPGAYPTPEDAAEGLLRRLEHDGWTVPVRAQEKQP